MKTGLLAGGLLLAVTMTARAQERDSTVYTVLPASRMEVKTGKAGLMGFAGHEHVIVARGFSGRVVQHTGNPAQSHVEMLVPTDSLEVTSPPDTAEIRKVTASMRTEVLDVAHFPEIRLATKSASATANGMHLVALLTMHGRTREVPLDVRIQVRGDTLHAATAFAVNQTDFDIRPFRGGPGGTVRVADRVSFTIDVLALREGAHR